MKKGGSVRHAAKIHSSGRGNMNNILNSRAIAGMLFLTEPAESLEVLSVCDKYGITTAHFTDKDSCSVYAAAMRLRAEPKKITMAALVKESGVNASKISVFDDAGAEIGTEYLEVHVRGLRDDYIKAQAIKTIKRTDNAEGLRVALDAIRGTLPIPEHSNGFTVRSWGECVDMELPAKRYFWGSMFACGQVQALFGQGGLGKSRLGTNLARNQVLGLDFLGETTGQPLRHLFIGSENDVHRWQLDCRLMSKGLTQAQIAALSDHIHMTTLENADDVSINLGDPDSLQKWVDTLHGWPPDVLWVDPWGDVIEGDGFDRDVRSTLRTLRKLAGAVNPDCGIVILAHARTGTANIIQAAGFDAANFGKESKALYSCSRAVVNVAPFDGTEDPDLVWIAAKCNDSKRPAPLRITLDPDTFTYKPVEALDVEQWQATVKAALKPKANRPDFDPDKVRELFKDGPITKTELHNLIRSMGITEQSTRAGIAGMIRKKSLIEKSTGKRNQRLIGTLESFKHDKDDSEFVEFG